MLAACFCSLPQSQPLSAQDSTSVPHPSTPDSAEANSTIQPNGLPGTLVIVGGGEVPQDALNFMSQFVASDKSVVVLTTASADRTSAGERATAMLSQAGMTSILIAPESDDAADEVESLTSLLNNAGGVWICGGQQRRLAERFVGTDVEMALVNLLARGGVVGGSSAGAAIMSGVMIESGQEIPVISRGFDLLPGAIVDQHFSQRNRLARSKLAVEKHPGRFGLGIDEDTAALIRGRTMRVVGAGQATIVLGGCDYREAEEINVGPGNVIDIVQLRRAARARMRNQNPGEPQFGLPTVEKGSLVIVGGGGMPTEIVDRFIELAGGKEAHIICLPTAGSRRSARRATTPSFLANADVASVTMLPQMGIDEVSSETFQSAVERATGVWFGGGRQWNFIDAYDGSNAVTLFHNVLERGGVIGGSSAGATIQGEFLVRGHPLGNTIMMAEGYERGFAFLPGVAIDQHFSQRGRQPDLIPVIQRHSRMLGIGIDEATALIVQGRQAEVIGKHAVHFLDHNGTANGEYVTVKSGESIDLQTLTSE